MDIRDGKRVLAIVLFSLIGVVSVLSPIYLLTKDEDVKGIAVKVEEVGKYPYISNVMPKVGYVDEEYIFVPRVVGSESKNIQITIKQGPTWLYVEDMVVRGIPSIDDVGSYKVVIKVDDGMASSEITEYIIVDEYEA